MTEKGIIIDIKEIVMISFEILFKYVLLFIALMIPGYLIGRLRKPDSSGTQMAGFILTDIAMPFLVFSSFLKTDITGLEVGDALCALLLPFVLTAVLYLVTLVAFKNRDGMDRKKIMADRYCSIIPNCGFIGMPLAMAVFGADSNTVVLISIYNVANTFIILTFGGYILSGKSKFSLRKLIFSPVNFAIIFGVAFSLLGVGVKFPMSISYADYLASLTTPLSMTVLGYELSKVGLSQIAKNMSVYSVSFIKLVASPIAAMGMLLVLRNVFGMEVSEPLAIAVFIASGVSTAATAPSIATQHGADSEQAAITTLGTTIICGITLPLLYLFCDFLF